MRSFTTAADFRPDVIIRSAAGRGVHPETDPLRKLAGLGLLGASAAILVATLAPFEFARPASYAFDLSCRHRDVLLNLLMMVPFGVLYCAAARGRVPALGEALAAGAAFSTAVELAQWFVPARRASPFDMLANAAGAWFGACLYRELGPWLDSRMRLLLRAEVPFAERFGVLLWPLLGLDALVNERPQRALLWLPLALVFVLLDARPAIPRAAQRGWLRSLVWFVSGTLPALPNAPGRIAVAAACVALAAHALERRPALLRAPRAALIAAAIAFGVYLAGGALLPLRFGGAFHFTNGFAWGNSNREFLLCLLASAYAFALLGYALRELGLRSLARVASVLTIGLAFELVRGFGLQQQASLLTLAILLCAAAWGAALQRARRAGDRGGEPSPALLGVLGQRART